MVWGLGIFITDVRFCISELRRDTSVYDDDVGCNWYWFSRVTTTGECVYFIVRCCFYRAMRMHSAVKTDSGKMSVLPSVIRKSVCHTPVFCLNRYTYPQSYFTIG